MMTLTHTKKAEEFEKKKFFLVCKFFVIRKIIKPIRVYILFMRHRGGFNLGGMYVLPYF